MGDINITDKENRQKLYNVYTESKTLFIEAEERLPEMKFFPAPTLEHRDALEHIMRYFELSIDGVISEAAEKELDSALGHEMRAFFDTADFICINVRKQMSASLKRIPTRKINRVWSDYWKIKEQIFILSDEIADIRKNRKGTMEYVYKYKKKINELWDIYSNFELNVMKKLKEKNKKDTSL